MCLWPGYCSTETEITVCTALLWPQSLGRTTHQHGLRFTGHEAKGHHIGTLLHARRPGLAGAVGAPRSLRPSGPLWGRGHPAGAEGTHQGAQRAGAAASGTSQQSWGGVCPTTCAVTAAGAVCSQPSWSTARPAQPSPDQTRLQPSCGWPPPAVSSTVHFAAQCFLCNPHFIGANLVLHKESIS